MKFLGSIVLAGLLIGFIGGLLGDSSWRLIAAAAFAVIVVVGIATSRRPRSPTLHASRQPGDVPPQQVALTCLAMLGFISFFALLIAGHGKTPDLGNQGLLIRREHYILSDRNGPIEVTRARFVAIGLLSDSLWYGVAAAGAAAVFFQQKSHNHDRDAA